jgi:hypothetical protein
MKTEYLSVPLYLLLLLIGAWGARATFQLPPAPTRVNPVNALTGCLSSHDGYLRARLRSSNSERADMQIDWADADMQCDGGPRPENRGVRVTFAGHLPGHAGLVRLVFGIAASAGTRTARNVPANVTVIFEDEQKLYSTAGDGKCTIDELTAHGTRFVARGFCTEPAIAIIDRDALLIDRFDFAGMVRDEEAR